MLSKWIQFTVEPAMSGEFQLELQQLEAASTLELGCVYYAAFQDESKAEVFTVLESWADNAAFVAHREAPHTVHFKAVCGAMILEKSARPLKPLSPVLTPV